MLCFFLVFACSSTSQLENPLSGRRHAVELGGVACTVQILTSESAFVARRELEFELGVEGSTERLPETLYLRADMIHMSHGPTRSELRLEGQRYRGTVVFVMGGEWELEFFEDDALILSGQLLVREN